MSTRLRAYSSGFRAMCGNELRGDFGFALGQDRNDEPRLQHASFIILERMVEVAR
jgi:hypothetical protein